MLSIQFTTRHLPVTAKNFLQGMTVLILGLAAGFFFRTPLLMAAGLSLAGAVYISLNYPGLTVFLTVAMSLYANNLKNIFPVLDPYIELSSFNIRLWDPMIFGIIIALGWKILSGDERIRTTFIKTLPFLSLFFLILLFQIFRTIGHFGINALGEFRTYYGQFLLVPYLCVYVSTENQRIQILKVLMWMVFLLIPIAILNALFSPALVMGIRWVDSFGAVALLHGLIALLIFAGRRLFNLSKQWHFSVVLMAGFIIIFTSHRSVWLASTAAVAALIIGGHLKLKQLVAGLAVICLLGTAAYISLEKTGYQPKDFVTSRLKAFTNPTKDPTANWRAYIWIEAVKDIIQQPLLGAGLGTHFNLVIGPHKELVKTSPHNLYITIPFQIGIPGLLAYLGFVAMLFYRFGRNIKLADPWPRDRALLTTGIVILASMQAFYIAYTTEFGCISWAFIGLAASVLVSSDLNKEGIELET
jgi:O-antigen ligase